MQTLLFLYSLSLFLSFNTSNKRIAAALCLWKKRKNNLPKRNLLVRLLKYWWHVWNKSRDSTPYATRLVTSQRFMSRLDNLVLDYTKTEVGWLFAFYRYLLIRFWLLSIWFFVKIYVKENLIRKLTYFTSKRVKFSDSLFFAR